MFFCQECGHKFRTIKAAERAAFGHVGCPTCGSSDIDLGKPAPRHSDAKYAQDCAVCIASPLSPDKAIDAHVAAVKVGL
jgi:hypothetical protein